MTHRTARSSRRRLPLIWLLPILILIAILALTAADYLSRSLLVDLVAWWPVWLFLAVIGVSFGRRRIGRLRVSGLLSILVAAVLMTFLAGHVNGWPINPSASRHLTGPLATSFATAELVALVDGGLHLDGGSDFLYQVEPLPGGGDVGVPSAVERRAGDAIVVSLEAPGDPGFDRSPGWDIVLSTTPRWELTLGGEVDANLSGLEVEELDVSGSGLVVLGVADEEAVVIVEGVFTVRIPAGVPARVVGDARVPDSWIETPDGWTSPGGGIGWVISVSTGSVVSIEEI